MTSTADQPVGQHAFTPAAPGWWAYYAEHDPHPTGEVWRDPVAGWRHDTRTGDLQAIVVGPDGLSEDPRETDNFLAVVGPGSPDVPGTVCEAMARAMGEAWTEQVAAQVRSQVVALNKPRGEPGHAVAVGDVVALGLSPTPAGDPGCPVGMVAAVGPLGVTLELFNWVVDTFGAGRVLVVWSRVLEVRWATQDADGVFVMDPLGDFQTEWKRGAEAPRERKRQERADAGAAR